MGNCHARNLDVSIAPPANASPVLDLTFDFSLIEANLVIVTGCLPTMRLFFRHVAPGLIGESSIRSRNRKQSHGYATDPQHHKSELKTIGSQHTTKAYNRMDDDGVSVGSEERPNAGWQADGLSERGIVSPTGVGRITKTQSFVVESEIWKEGGDGVRRSSNYSMHMR